MNATSTVRSLAAIGVCLALAVPAHAQIGPIPKNNTSSVGGKHAANANQPPVCDSGPTVFLECTGQMMSVQLDGSLSYDPEGDPITFEWFIKGGCNAATLSDPSSPTPILFFDPANNCLDECGAITLRVRDGQASSFCSLAVVVHDLMPPVVAAPIDVMEPFTTGYPAQASTAVQGTASATDCDPNPIMGYTDTYSSGPLPTGVEDIVHRLWRSVDECGNVGEEVQVIVFVAPAFFAGAPVDIMPGFCDNMFQVGPGLTTFDSALLSETGFAADLVQLGSLKIKRADGLGTAVAPVGSQILEMGTPSTLNSCSKSAPDLAMDVLMTFDQSEVINSLLLDQEKGDSIVVIEIYGNDQNGQPFRGYDLIRIEAMVGTGGGGPGPGTGAGGPTQSKTK